MINGLFNWEFGSRTVGVISVFKQTNRLANYDYNNGEEAAISSLFCHEPSSERRDEDSLNRSADQSVNQSIDESI